MRSFGLPLAMLLAVAAPAASGGEAAQPAEEAKLCLARALYFEAGSEGEKAMEAVAAVVLNRVAHPEFPDDVCAVVEEGGEEEGCQFSFWCDGRSDAMEDEELARQAMEVAGRALAGEIDDPTGGALFFQRAGSGGKPTPDAERSRRIGDHVFFRLD